MKGDISAMNGLYKEKGERYFAAANTKDGFVSYFDEIFGNDCCDRVYILKGGPGVGKSTFMKRLGALAEENGLGTEYFHCSSDPLSLDGIIIKEKRAAVIDGTSPHAAEPKLAGAREIIIDLGRAWNTDKLFENKEKIRELSQKKSRLYSDCYKYLYSKSVIDGILYNMAFPYILFDKLDKSAARLTKSIFKGVKEKCGKKQSIRITNAISTLGKVRLSAFEDMADFCVFIKEPYKESRLPSHFLRAVYDNAKNLQTDILVSYSPEKNDCIDALYFPQIKVSLSLYDDNLVAECDKQMKKCRIINCARFMDMTGFSSLKPLRKFYSRLSESIEKQALESLKEAGNLHAELEKVYSQCTNYKTVEKISDEYFKKIL